MKIALWLVIYFALSVSYLPAEHSQQTSRRASNVGELKGQVGAEQKTGVVLPAQSATVYVMFASGMASGSFTHRYDTDTAGGQYKYKLEKLVGSANKQVKTLAKSGQADEIAKIYLGSVDAALAAVSEWANKHPDRAWQVRTVTPDTQGFWSTDDLPPGSYEIVVRGAVGGHDADWEASVGLDSGKTISLPLTRPRFFRL